MKKDIGESNFLSRRLDAECSAFLALESSDENLPVPQTLLQDLVGSPRRLMLTYGGATFFGYLLSLAICAQCSFGLTSFSWHMAGMIHQMPDPLCPVVCGMIFGLVPAIVSSLFLTTFQHRYLLFRMSWLPVLLPIFANAVMLLGGMVHAWTWYAVWFLSAALTPYGIEWMASRWLRQKSFVES